MLTYHALAAVKDDQVEICDEINNKNSDEIKMSHHLIQKVMKSFGTHRNASDFESKFISRVVDKMYNTSKETVGNE